VGWHRKATHLWVNLGLIEPEVGIVALGEETKVVRMGNEVSLLEMVDRMLVMT
jgi:hypothetical protein